MTQYTSVQELLEHAAGAEIPVVVDLATVAARGRSRVRRRRAALAAAVAVLVAGGITAATTLGGTGHPQPARPTPTVTAGPQGPEYGWRSTPSSQALAAELGRLSPQLFGGLSQTDTQSVTGDASQKKGPQLIVTVDTVTGHTAAEAQYLRVTVFHGRPGEHPDRQLWNVAMPSCDQQCDYDRTLPDGSLVRVRHYDNYPGYDNAPIRGFVGVLQRPDGTLIGLTDSVLEDAPVQPALDPPALAALLDGIHTLPSR
ncbi:MAG: hypothetical protein ACJ73S_20155 [Mycobacteriales bacterium]